MSSDGRSRQSDSFTVTQSPLQRSSNLNLEPAAAASRSHFWRLTPLIEQYLLYIKSGENSHTNTETNRHVECVKQS